MVRRLSQPTLLVWADGDPVSPPAVGQRLASLLPSARLEVVAADSHLFANEAPELVAAHIRRHLEGGQS